MAKPRRPVDTTGESGRTRWWVRFFVVPVLIPVVSSAGSLFAGIWLGSRSAVKITGTANSYDRSAWGILYFDDVALAGLSEWIKVANIPTGAAPELHYMLGRAYHQLGDFANASAEYAKAQSVPDARYMRALTFSSMHSPDAALELLDGILKDDPADIAATYARGVCLLQKLQYPAARDCFQRVADQRPEALGAWHDLGVCSLHLGDYPAALRFFTHVSEKNPLFARAVVNKGLALFHLGRKREALEAISTGVHLDSRRVADLEKTENEAIQTDPVIGNAIREIISKRYP